jgi:thiol-disulfide isomerase/thioredoxin
MLAKASFTESSPIPWMQDGPAVIFYAGKSRYRIARVPPIVGVTNQEEIFGHDPMYRREMEEYEPDLGAVSALQQVGSKAIVEVWFGSWCPHCRKMVPRFQKAAANPNLEVLYHAVPRQFGDYDPARERNVKGLPTFIFLRNGKEFGRIRGGGESAPLETELARILSTASLPAGG